MAGRDRARRPAEAPGNRTEDKRMDINADAPVITRDEIVITAPIQTIWDIQTDVAAWPSWQPDVDGADADGP
jgi:hypothetical protein